MTLPTASGPSTRPVSVRELQLAWAAVQAGQFRSDQFGAGAHPPTVPPHGLGVGGDRTARDWTPTEMVVVVAGCAGCCGVTTTAVALATVAAAELPAAALTRVVEASPASQSGLLAASTVELGIAGNGWVRGRRGPVLLERTTAVMTSPRDVPVPAPAQSGVALTILDVGWDDSTAVAAQTWVTPFLTERSSPRVLVATATVPGMRRLETALSLIDLPPAASMSTELLPVLAVLGPPPRRWPRPLSAAIGPLTAALREQGRLVTLPTDQHLSVLGLTPAPLPRRVLAAADQIYRLLPQHTPSSTDLPEGPT